MKRWSSTARLCAFAAVGTAAACVLFGLEVGADEAPKEPGKGYTLHEWGVFIVHPNLDLANADMRAEWESMPKEFYGQSSGRSLPISQIPVLKPVVYFHAPEALEVALRVDFPKPGIPAVWWPATATPSFSGDRRLRREPVLNRSLAWRLHLKDNFPAERGGPLPLRDFAAGWIKTLRDVKADDVYASVGGMGYGFEREKFVYYDGLLARGQWADVTAAKQKVTVRNRGKGPLLDLTAVDRRADGTIYVARREKLDGGAEIAELEFASVDKVRWPAEAVATLTKQLAAAGLNEDEGAALVKVWEKELFKTEGLTVFYRLPQEEYERLLPLTAKPAPKETVRVGLVVHPHCESDLAARVAALVKQLDDAEFGKRQEAQERLVSLGRPAVGLLLGLRNGNVPLELKQRLDEILAKHESAKAISVGTGEDK